jgi:hypothetical protein
VTGRGIRTVKRSKDGLIHLWRGVPALNAGKA